MFQLTEHDVHFNWNEFRSFGSEHAFRSKFRLKFGRNFAKFRGPQPLAYHKQVIKLLLSLCNHAKMLGGCRKLVVIFIAHQRVGPLSRRSRQISEISMERSACGITLRTGIKCLFVVQITLVRWGWEGVYVVYTSIAKGATN